MKKTIITLAAFAAACSGMVSAAITAGPDYGGNFWISDFDFTFEITEEQIAEMTSGTTYTLAAYWGTDAANWAGANIFTLTTSDNGIVLTAGRGGVTTSTTDGVTTATWKSWDTDNSQYKVVYTGLTAGVYTLNTTGESGKQTVSLLDSDGSTLAGGITYNGNMNGDDSTPQSYFNTDFEVKPVVTPGEPGEGGSAAIPEPATATLSLLALAGLAARRRRK